VWGALRQTAIGQERQQIRSGTCHTRPDSPDRASANSGRFLIGQTQHLGKHEGGPPIRVQASNKIGDADLFACIGCRALVGGSAGH
jgi:hypothetical protein